jgi:hypothetical protein
MARAIATRWRWPPDGLIPRAPTVVSRPVGQGLGELGDVCRLRGTVDFGVAGTGVANAMLSPSVRWNMAGPVACRRSTCAGLPERRVRRTEGCCCTGRSRDRRDRLIPGLRRLPGPARQGGHHLQDRSSVNAELIVAAADVLDKRLPSNDDPD